MRRLARLHKPVSLRTFATKPAPRHNLSTQVATQATVTVDMEPSDDISSGAMYSWRVRAVHDALRKRGKATGPLGIDDLCSLGHLDQYHYLGLEACDDVADTLNLGPGSTLLDVGSGIGGPARYLAATTGCRAIGVELQAELCDAATELTARVPGLSDRVQFINGDASQLGDLPHDSITVDHFVSLLVNLHVPDRRALHENLHARLAPGGTFFIEDFAAIAPPTLAEAHTLLDLVKAPSVTSIADYVAELEECGFVDVEATDFSAPWAAWCRARSDEYNLTEADAVALNGRPHFEARSHFYEEVANLFAGGRVGGVRLTGRKPGAHERSLQNGRRRQALRTRNAPVRILENGAAFGETAVANGTTAAVNGVNGIKTPTAAVSGGAFGVAATQASSAQLLPRPVVQPPLPYSPQRTPGLHDSLQYHFFLEGGLFVAIRVFHTDTLQSTTAWLHEPGLGSVELINTYAPLEPDRKANGILLEGEEMTITDNGGTNGVAIDLRPKSAEAIAALQKASGRRELRIVADEGHGFGWIPAGADATSDGPVIHRPQMSAKVDSWRGEEVAGYGYSKRYYAIYPRHNGWRFIHGVSTPSGDVHADAANPPSIVWTADATFGDHKVRPMSPLTSLACFSLRSRAARTTDARASPPRAVQLLQAAFARGACLR